MNTKTQYATLADDPIQRLLNVYNNLFDKPCTVIFREFDEDDERLGCTSFDGEIPQVLIRVDQTLPQILDIMAHELAHVAIGYDVEEEHGPLWEQAYADLHYGYMASFSIEVDNAE